MTSTKMDRLRNERFSVRKVKKLIELLVQNNVGGHATKQQTCELIWLLVLLLEF